MQVNGTPSKKMSSKPLSSIENKIDLKSNVKNIQPKINENNYSVSQDIKDSFYAIHHISRSNKENDTTAFNDEKSNHRGRKRSIVSLQSMDSIKRKKPRPTIKSKKDQHHHHPYLSQTCLQLWPESNTTHESSTTTTYDHIKSLSNLLKVRLNQAKFKMMAKLDKDNELFSFLADDYVSPKLKSPFTVHIPSKVQKSRSSLAVVGNGKNLFNHRFIPSSSSSIFDTLISSSSITEKSKISKDRKKKTTPKPKRISTKRKSVAADVIPVTLSDGTCVFVCDPCNKKYKNRNGLAYHMERCKNIMKTTDDKESSSQQSSNSIDCICSQSTDENMTMIQCEKCRNWSHSECVGISEDMLEEVFYCSNCKKESLVLPFQNPIHDQDQNEEDELLSNGDDDTSDHLVSNSSQLHVWDDFNMNSDQWNVLDEEEPYSNYDTDLPSSSWNMSLFSNQPPSLLFSDTTLNSSTLDDDLAALTEDCTSSHNQEGLWFQFANFDDDYQCDNNTTTS